MTKLCEGRRFKYLYRGLHKFLFSLSLCIPEQSTRGLESTDWITDRNESEPVIAQ